MERTVKDFTNYKPRGYNGTNFYAANVFNANRGYVLWQYQSNAESGFTVYMEMERTNARCEVVRWK